MQTNTLCILFILSCISLLGFSQDVNKISFEDWEVNPLKEDGINTEFAEWFPMILPDGLTLYFSSDRPGGQGELDIYVTHRETRKSSWKSPIRLGENINSKAGDHSVTISDDGHYMYFTSAKKGGYGDDDLYFSYRDNTDDDFGWGKAVNLGEMINTDSKDACPLYHKTNGQTQLYFVSFRNGGVGGADIYRSILNVDKKQFEQASLFNASTTFNEYHFEPNMGLIWADRKGGKENKIFGSHLIMKLKIYGTNQFVLTSQLIQSKTTVCHQ